jgi:hypothetical protein
MQFKIDVGLLHWQIKIYLILSLFGKFGPKLTFKSLTKDTFFVNKALDINNWKYSLGDLELF